MERSDQIVFGPYRLDPDNPQLWQGEQAVALQPKPLAVLQYLTQRPGQLVTKAELLKTVWAGTVVTKAVVKECLRAIRQALQEEASAPRYIETVGREGYRFLGTVVGSQQSGVSSATPTQDSAFGAQPSILVGREAELTRLQAALRNALNGERQLIFVTGESGIGKTTLIDRFREQSRTNRNITIGYGQCIEQYGGGEAYLPILEAMGRLCREAGGQGVTATLRQYAPTWLVQLSGIMDESEAQALRLQVQGATQQRMLREMAEALEQITRQQPLLLILEDLHWSDQATVELLSYLAQRRERARLLIIGTYRPADLVLRNHPLKAIKQELQAKRQCEEVRLELLSLREIRDYLSKRFPHNEFPSNLAEEIHRRTEGNALFMVNIMEELLQQSRVVKEQECWILKGNIRQVNVPDTLRQLIEKQVQQRSEQERRVLEVASVVGIEFAVAAVAAVLKQDMDEVEEGCEELAWQGHFLEERGVAEWPDGTVSGRYAFRHALYQNVLYERIAEARRVRLHRSIGEYLEASYSEQAKEIAAELALHFEQGRDYRRAVLYHQAVGIHARQHSANLEAVTHLSKGIALLQRLPATQERAQQELELQLLLSTPVGSTKGEGSPELEQIYARAFALCQQMGETAQLFPTVFGLWLISFTRGKLSEAHKRAEQLLNLAQEIDPLTLPIWGHDMLGLTLCYCGKFPLALSHLQRTLELYDVEQYRAHAFDTGQDPGMSCLTYMSGVLRWIGYPDQALQRVQEAFTLAREMSRPFGIVAALLWAGELHVARGEISLAQERAEAAIAYATEQGFTEMLAWGTALRGWTFIEQGKVAEGQALMLQGRTALENTGTKLGIPIFLAGLAQVSAQQGQVEEGLQILAEGLEVVQRTEERRHEAELYRLKGELMLQKQLQVTSPRSKVLSAQAEAEECFRKAIEVAQRQKAKSWELRATTSLARLWQQQGKRAEAQGMLSKVYNWFTEGFDTKDLQEAKALIKELNH